MAAVWRRVMERYRGVRAKLELRILEVAHLNGICIITFGKPMRLYHQNTILRNMRVLVWDFAFLTLARIVSEN